MEEDGTDETAGVGVVAWSGCSGSGEVEREASWRRRGRETSVAVRRVVPWPLALGADSSDNPQQPTVYNPRVVTHQKLFGTPPNHTHTKLIRS
jgi:hypothetical protein